MNASVSPIRVALVGCGAVASQYYAPALRVLSGEGLLEVVGLVDPDAENLGGLASRFPRARRHPEATALTDDSVDLAIVATPPQLHAAQSIQLLRRGIAVLCEKPMAATLVEAESMIDAADAAGRVLAVGLVRRFLPAAQTIRGILSVGALGAVCEFRFTEGGRFRWPTRSTAYFEAAGALGGVLADIGTHLLDLVVWWMGEPSELGCEVDAMGGVDANCRISLRFPGGGEGTVRLSRDTDLPGRCFIRGARGWLLWNVGAPDELALGFEGVAPVLGGRLCDPATSRSGPRPGRRVRNFEQSFVAQLRNVVGAVRGDEQAFVSGREALEGLRLVEKCYRDRTLMPMGWLNSREQDRARTLSGRPSI